MAFIKYDTPEKGKFANGISTVHRRGGKKYYTT